LIGFMLMAGPSQVEVALRCGHLLVIAGFTLGRLAVRDCVATVPTSCFFRTCGAIVSTLLALLTQQCRS
jgi:hypothetical protein